MRVISYTAAFAALVACSQASASITQYSSRAAFNAAAGPLGLENFESFTPTQNAFYNKWFDFGAFSVFNGPAANGGGGDISSGGSVNGSIEINGSIAINGAQYFITFDQPITALGFDADNLADQRYDDLTFNNATTDVVQVHDTVDQVRFWGFISSTPFTSITIRQVGFSSGGTNTEGFRFDDIAYSVPEPHVLMAALGAGLLVRRRERR